jgi:cytosine permease
MLPDYITKAVPNPQDKRAPWYVNTAPSYAGVFLWVAFYQSMADGTINRAGLGVCLLALAVAGLLSYAWYYCAPAMLGMKTGYPLYVVGSSTFGTRGGYLMPGILMGLLQVGWFAVATSLSTVFILKGANLLRGVQAEPQPGSPLFIVVAVLWGYILGYVGVKGIQYVAKVALYLNLIAFLMVLVVFLKTSGGLSRHTVTNPEPWAAFTLLIQVVIGFFATAGAAGADFGMNNRNAKDVRLGGLVGITLAILYAGGLPLMSVAGARALHPELTSFGYDAAIGSIGGFLATAMFFLFAIASIAPACFCAFICGNSFATMFPRVPRMTSTLTGVTIAIVLAITGVAANLAGVFTIVGASFGPICGYIAWALGFTVGIIPFLPLSAEFKKYSQPVVVYSFLVGFLVYAVLAKAGLQPKTVPVSGATAGA